MYFLRFFSRIIQKGIPDRSCLSIPLVALSLFGSGGLAGAENLEDVNATRTLLMDSVVVTAPMARQTRQTGDVDLELIPGFFSVIEREQFEGRMESLAEVIEKETGVQVRQSGGLGSFSSVSLRGSSSDQVIVFLDGILLNDASGGGVDLSSIALSDVESIEVYKGITPPNFGRASIGGAINIRTNRSEKGFSGSASLGIGSFNTRQGSFILNHKPARWDYLLSADLLKTDNDFIFLNDRGTIWNPDDDELQKRENAAVERFNLLAKAGFDFTKDCRLELINQWFSKDQELPTWNNSPRAKTTFDTRRNMTTLGLIGDDLGSLGLNTHFKFHHTWKEEIYDDSGGFVGLGQQKDRYTTTRTGSSAYGEWFAASHLLSLFTEFYHERYEPEDLLRDANPRDSTRNALAATLQDNWFLLGERLILSPALRLSWVDDDLDSGTSYYGLPLEGRSRSREDLTPQFGFKFRATDWLHFKANWAEYVREPSFFELFGDRGLFMGNVDLRAEKGMNLDCGLEIEHRLDQGPFQRIHAEAVFFYSDVDDLITRTYDARGVGKSVNVSGSEIKGLELGLHLDFWDHFRLIASGTWQETENQSEVAAFDGKQLPGRYERAYLGRIEYLIQDCKVYLEKIVEEGRYYDTANLLKAEDKSEVNLGASLAYKDWVLNLEVCNFEDNQYEDFNSYPLPGRSYSVNLKYSF